jgi:hypothetical protein
MPELTVASFNLHWGIDRHGQPFDPMPACIALDADVRATYATGCSRTRGERVQHCAWILSLPASLRSTAGGAWNATVHRRSTPTP